MGASISHFLTSGLRALPAWYAMLRSREIFAFELNFTPIQIAENAIWLLACSIKRRFTQFVLVVVLVISESFGLSRQ